MKPFRDLDPREMSGAAIFLDIDGTLVPHGSDELAAPEAHALATLAHEAKVYLLAGRGHHRAVAWAKEYGAESVTFDSLKPSSQVLTGVAIPRGMRRVVVGDKVISDGILARNIGASFIRVKRLVDGRETLFISLVYLLDAIAWVFASAWRAFRRSDLMLYIRLARPKQWGKNLIILVPLAIAGGFADPALLRAAILAIVAFSAAASVSYVMDDVFDCADDARDPAKKNRPIACGIVSVPSALTYAGLLAIAAAAAAATVPAVIPWVMGYLALTYLYTLVLKRVPVVELFAVAGFYLLRVGAGAAILGISASQSLTLIVFFAALLVAAGGRYADSRGPRPPEITKAYPREFLALIPIFCAMLTVVAYVLATLGASPLVFATNALALFAVLIYLREVYKPTP